MSLQQDDFFNAIKNGSRAVIEEMLAQEPQLAGARENGGMSAVLTAIYYQQPEIAGLLIERGAPLDLFEASAAGQVEVVREILKTAPAGSVNAWATDGFQPLGLASFFGHTALVELLLDSGAEVGSASRNPLNVQPINSAVAGQHLEITRLLLAHGADPNARQGENITPLHAAAQNGQIEMIQLLLDHGADPRALDGNGKTAYDYAVEASHPQAAELVKLN